MPAYRENPPASAAPPGSSSHFGDRADFAIFGEPVILRVAFDALCDVFDEDLNVLWVGLRHLPELRLPGLVDQVLPIEEQHQRHGFGAANVAGQCGKLQQVARAPAERTAAALRRINGSSGFPGVRLAPDHHPAWRTRRLRSSVLVGISSTRPSCSCTR
jgi:hypothetical protein